VHQAVRQSFRPSLALECLACAMLKSLLPEERRLKA
jgi:hypothetical protein